MKPTPLQFARDLDLCATWEAAAALIESRDREVALRAQIAELQTLRKLAEDRPYILCPVAVDIRLAELRKELGDV